MAEYKGAAKCYPFTTIPNQNIYRDVHTDNTPIYTSIQYIQCSPVVEGEEDLSRPYEECEVPKELLSHRDQLMRPLDIGFERFEEIIWKISSSSSSSSNCSMRR